MWEQFITDDQSGALRLDSLRTSHPIQAPTQFNPTASKPQLTLQADAWGYSAILMPRL